LAGPGNILWPTGTSNSVLSSPDGEPGRPEGKGEYPAWKKDKMRQRMKEFSDLPLELKLAMRKKYPWFYNLPEE